MMMLNLDCRLWYHVAWRPLIFLLIYLGTASEIPSLILSTDLIYITWSMELSGTFYDMWRTAVQCCGHVSLIQLTENRLRIMCQPHIYLMYVSIYTSSCSIYFHLVNLHITRPWVTLSPTPASAYQPDASELRWRRWRQWQFACKRSESARRYLSQPPITNPDSAVGACVGYWPWPIHLSQLFLVEG